MVAPSKTKVARKRVAIYARRSDASGDRDRSLPEQVSACRRWAEERGHEVARVYEELGSGVTGSGRPVFLSMIADSERKGRPFDIVLVLDLSRFGRADVDETGFYRHRLRVAGVEVAYVMDGEALAGPSGGIVAAVYQVAARDHSRKTGFKVALAHAATVARGCWPGGRVPYGYVPVRRPDADPRGKTRQDVRLVIHEERAAVVRRIFASYGAGASPLSVAAALNADRIPSPGGQRWIRTSVLRIVENPAYCGDLVLNDPRRRHPVQQPKFHRTSAAGVVSADADAAPLVQRDAIPPIVPRAEWNRVQDVIRGRSRAPSTGGTPLLLSSLARCGSCGGPLRCTAGRTNPSGSRARYYGCARSRQHATREGRGDCQFVNLRSERLEQPILAALRSRAARIDPARLARDLRAALPSAPRVDVAALEAKRRKLAARRDALLLESEGDEFLRGGLARLAEEDARLAREIEAARAVEAQGVDVEAAVASAVEAARSLAKPISDEDVVALRAQVRRFVKRIEVQPAPAGAPKPVVLEVYKPQALAVTGTGAIHWRLGRRS